MKNDVNLENISDGRLYGIDDFVKSDTEGCGTCSACCHGVGELVSLNPFDVYGIVKHLNSDLNTLLAEHFVMTVEGKIALPHLKMKGEKERCTFLNGENRCAIHSARPNICRLFPLGRVYDNEDFKYFLQTDACVKSNLKLIKVRQWIGIESYDTNHTFINDWHHLMKALTFRLKFVRDAEELATINDYFFDTFYRQISESPNDFYTAFYERLSGAKKQLGIL